MNAIPFKHRYRFLVLINLLALAASFYLIKLHFKPDLSEVCNLGENWNCEIVNKSIYSEFFGIPVSILGAGTYLLLLIFSIRGLFKNQKKLIPYVFVALTGALGFALYLTGIEAFVLKTFCLFCVTQQILILFEYGISLSFLKNLKSRTS